MPVITAISPSNELQKQRAVAIIESKGKRNIGIFGLSFKPGTDDLRKSPSVDLVETLLGKGYQIKIYDKNVRVSQLTGTNADFIAARLPHLNEMIDNDLHAVAETSEVLVIANREEEFAVLPARYPHKVIVDLVRQYQTIDYEGDYEGLSWGGIK